MRAKVTISCDYRVEYLHFNTTYHPKQSQTYIATFALLQSPSNSIDTMPPSRDTIYSHFNRRYSVNQHTHAEHPQLTMGERK